MRAFENLSNCRRCSSRLLWGEKSSTVINMNGGMNDGRRESNAVRFHYDGLEGQKTGAFLDQRENYAAAAEYAHGEALDAFCYQGGFALHLAAKCASVTGVDSSRPALEMAEKNAALNGRELEWIEGNAFDLLREYAAANRRYDTIVLDPPAFAKTKRDLEKALGGYKELNLRAMKMLRPGGILVTCSCSFHVGAVGLPGSGGRRGPRRPQIPAPGGEPGSGEGPSNPAECAGNQLPPVPDIECKRLKNNNNKLLDNNTLRFYDVVTLIKNLGASESSPNQIQVGGFKL